MFNRPISPRACTTSGCYSAELAEAFRQGARDLCSCSLGDRIEILRDALVSPAEGGVWVTAQLYVADGERASLNGEEASVN